MMWSKLKQDIWEWRGFFRCADNHWYCDRPTVDRDYQVLLNYRGWPLSFRTLLLTDVLETGYLPT